jgi:four helix bundle protein
LTGGGYAHQDVQGSQRIQGGLQAGLGGFKIRRKLPQYEQFELGRQLRRSGRSVPANIVEGWAKRASAPEFKRYLMVAIGSCDESKFWLELSRDEGYANAVEADALANRFNLVGAMLKSLWKNWKNFAN